MIDNSGFLGVVTLKSPSGVLSRWFSPFVNKSPILNLFSVAFSPFVNKSPIVNLFSIAFR